MSSGWLGSHGTNRFDTSHPGLVGPKWAGRAAPHLNVKDAGLRLAIERAKEFLLNRQAEAGYWVGELQGDSILESEYILLLAFLGKGQSERAQACARYLLQVQESHGGWSQYPGGPTEISSAVKAYLALKITGHSVDHPAMVRARTAILSAGGIEKVNSFTRFYLAMLGLISYDDCPAVPPEMVLLPKWFPIHLGAMSAWSRTIVVPLSLLWAFRPKSPLDSSCKIDELYCSADKKMPREIGGVNHEGPSRGLIDYSWMFRKIDSAWKLAERCRLMWLRKLAVARAERWILNRLVQSDGLGAIFPPIVWTIIGLRCLGHADDSPTIIQQMDELEKLVLTEGDTVRLQPCLSPVWDTAISVIALRDAGVPRDHESMRRATRWLLSKEVRSKGDWSDMHPDVEPGGWYFEFNNEFYPDVDDTAMTLIALSRMLPDGMGTDWTLDLTSDRKHESNTSVVLSGRSASAETALREFTEAQPLADSIRRGINWLRALQSKDGGWGAFDSDNTRELLTKVPFADHNAMIDPSTSDITARVLESFACYGIDRAAPNVQRALRFIWSDQQTDSCWFGRWGVNYIYGTWQVIVGLVDIGVPKDDFRIQRGADWLELKQQSCGGWGESIATYDDPTQRGKGTPTASQTAWAILGLLAAGRVSADSVQRGITFLRETQQPDGTWHEPEFTGTGFPRVFYLKYHLYSHYFPLMALARFAAKSQGNSPRNGSAPSHG